MYLDCKDMQCKSARRWFTTWCFEILHNMFVSRNGQFSIKDQRSCNKGN